MREKIVAAVADAIAAEFKYNLHPVLTRPDPQFGDFATNAALQLAKPLSANPRDIATTLQSAVLRQAPDLFKEVTVAGPGFLNFFVADAVLAEGIQMPAVLPLEGTKVLLEYSCPNAFKELHTGHLYQTVVGDALGRLLEQNGAKVYRANFGGDVGLHVAKCLWGIQKLLSDGADLDSIQPTDQPQWISGAYVLGARAYEEDEAAKQKIIEINAAIYLIVSDNDHSSDLAQVYWRCRKWSYDYFKRFYDDIEVQPFDAYYPESQTSEAGLALIKENMGSVFTESEGAVVYEPKIEGLHTRVFVTSKGLPTYEAKDLGVILNEVGDYPYDRRILMTGNDVTEYMKVLWAALNEIKPELAAKQTHLTNGTIRFGSGQKMSSRLGNVTRAVDVLDEVGAVVEGKTEVIRKQITLGAIKYSFLKHRLGGDIAFDIKESVSLEGNSGPYLQYAHARARSILRKASKAEIALGTGFTDGERALLVKLGEYAEVTAKAVEELLPHHICTYLYELAQEFNRFYEHNRVIGEEREGQRLALVKAYADTLQQGLNVLGIDAPEEM